MKRVLLAAALVAIPVMAMADWWDVNGGRHAGSLNVGNDDPVGSAIGGYTRLQEVNRRQQEFEHQKEMDDANQAMREDTERLRRETAKIQAEMDRRREADEASRMKNSQGDAQAVLQTRMEAAAAKWELLKKLHDSGAVTQEAFESAKKEIQDSMLAPIK